MRPIYAALRRLSRRPLPVIVALAVIGATGWAVIEQPPLQLAANCAGGGYGGSGTGGYGAPTGTCGPYVPLTPTRVLDTRSGVGGTTGPVGPGQTITLTLAGTNGVPAMPGASAVVLNVTAVVPTQASFLTVWPDGQPQPTASNLNFVAEETVANLVEVQLGTTGAVDFFNPFGSVQVVADLEGYVATSATGSAGLFNAMPGVRVLDTRNGTGGISGPVGPSATIRVPVTGGTTGVPATGVSAVVFNLTVTQPTAASDVTAYPDSTTRPTASNINFGAGGTIANRVIVPVVNGYVDLYNVQGDVQLIADINGYFTNSSVPANSGSDFNAEAPVRIVDTRTNSGIPYSGATLQPNGTLVVQVAGSAGVPLMSSTAPPTAVVLNLTEASANAPSFLAVWPSDVSRPPISDVNFGPGQVQPNLVVVQLSPLGQLSFYNAQGMTNIVVDVEGWYS
ncbi:MAG: hypothetical protein WA695_08815 [Candidatus Dormiibacterota bacterium]